MKHETRATAFESNGPSPLPQESLNGLNCNRSKSTSHASTQERALAQHRVLRNTYLLLAITLIPTAIGATIGANLNLSFLRSNPIISFFVILAVFYGWIWAIERNRDSAVGVGLLLGFTLFLGLLLGPLLQTVLGFRNGAQLVTLAAGGTAAVFFGLSALASSTTRDFQPARQLSVCRRDRDHARRGRECFLFKPGAAPRDSERVRAVLLAHHSVADQLDRARRARRTMSLQR